MSQSGHEPRIVATDLMTEAWLVQVFPGCFALVDEAGYPLRYDLFNWSMKPWVIRNDYRSGFFVVRKGINIVFGHRATSLLRKSSSTKIRKVGLVTPRLLGHANIVVREDDIMKYNEAFDRKFSFVRAANILNKGYFTDVELRGAIGNIRQYLATDAALLVVRTHQDGQNHGTLFTIGSGGNCKVLRRFGDGSEIEEIVLECVWNASVG